MYQPTNDADKKIVTEFIKRKALKNKAPDESLTEQA
jgi:hypothetical protein